MLHATTALILDLNILRMRQVIFIQWINVYFIHTMRVGLQHASIHGDWHKCGYVNLK